MTEPDRTKRMRASEQGAAWGIQRGKQVIGLYIYVGIGDWAVDDQGEWYMKSGLNALAGD